MKKWKAEKEFIKGFEKGYKQAIEDLQSNIKIIRKLKCQPKKN